MKTLLLLPLLLLAMNMSAKKRILVETGTLTTAPGIGGDAEVAYAFAKGDVVSIKATASKKLERMIVMIYPQEELGRDRSRKSPALSFTMPHDGIVIFRFISDQGGTNRISYSVDRMPASDDVQDYDTKIVWDKPPVGRPGSPVPRRAAD